MVGGQFHTLATLLPDKNSGVSLDILLKINNFHTFCYTYKFLVNFCVWFACSKEHGVWILVWPNQNYTVKEKYFLFVSHPREWRVQYICCKALCIFLPHYLRPSFRILNTDKERNEASSYLTPTSGFCVHLYLNQVYRNVYLWIPPHSCLMNTKTVI